MEHVHRNHCLLGNLACQCPFHTTPCNKSIVYEERTNLYISYSSTVLQQYKKSYKNTTPFKTRIISHLKMLGRVVLTSAGVQKKADPVGSRSYSPPSAPWSSLPSSPSLHGGPWHPSIPTPHIASYRRTLTAPRISLASGRTVTNRNTYGLSRKMVFQVIRL